MDNFNILQSYFPDLNASQRKQLEMLGPELMQWNQKINLISRKDVEHLYLRHILHSMAVANVIQFKPGTRILDFGTGGGFPGLPLAILFPSCEFHLADSIGKKIRVVQDLTLQLGLQNVTAEQIRVENINQTYDFVTGRAVTQLPLVLEWLKNKFRKESFNSLQNGLIYLKGGDFDQELSAIQQNYRVFKISEYFDQPYFETKKIVYIPLR